MLHQRNIMPQRYRAPGGARHQQRNVEGVGEQTWPSTFMALGIFVLIITFWWVGARTFVSYSLLARWFAFFAFVGNLLPYNKVGLRYGMERLEWFLFNLLAVGPLVFSVLLWMNLLVHGPERLVVFPWSANIVALHTYVMDHDGIPLHTEVGTSKEEAMHALRNGQRLLGTATGLFGYEVVVTWEKVDGIAD